MKLRRLQVTASMRNAARAAGVTGDDQAVLEWHARVTTELAEARARNRIGEAYSAALDLSVQARRDHVERVLVSLIAEGDEGAAVVAKACERAWAKRGSHAE